MKSVLAGLTLFVLGASLAQAQTTCPENFTNSGGFAPFIKTYDVFPSVSPAKALDNLARAAQVQDGWLNIRVDRRLNMITAENDGARSGRTQEVKIAVRKQGKGSRVDISYAFQPGQQPAGNFRLDVCRIIGKAAN